MVRALDGVNLTVETGEFVAVVGQSGSGKSTLLHMLGGLDQPTSGYVVVEGHELNGMSDEQLTIFRRRNIGFVFQNYNLVPILNVYENIVLPIELRRVLDIDKDAALEVYVDNDSIVLKKYQPACIFCGSAEGVAQYQGRNICGACREAIAALK